MPNRWITFLAGFRKRNSHLSMKQAMKQGAVEYRKKGKGKSAEPAAPKRRRRRKKKAL